MWDECNCAIVWTFFGIAFLWEWNENWPFPVPRPLLSLPNLLEHWAQHFSRHHLLGIEIAQLEPPLSLPYPQHCSKRWTAHWLLKLHILLVEWSHVEACSFKGLGVQTHPVPRSWWKCLMGSIKDSGLEGVTGLWVNALRSISSPNGLGVTFPGK